MQQSSYLKYLPAIFHKKPDLEELPNEIPFGDYLLPYEVILNQFDQLLATLDQYFSSELAPAEAFLSWLATWVALPLDEEWEDLERRLLIQEAVELYRWRGTVRGLKRYLELYARVPEEQIEIEEARWPAGMQIGVASRIGWKNSVAAGDMTRLTTPETTKHDYYVVSTVAPTEYPPGAEPPPLEEGMSVRLFYDTSRVERIEIEDRGVHIHYRSPGANSTVVLFHENHNAPDEGEPLVPNLTRRSGLVDYRYRRAPQFTQDDDNEGSNSTAVEYYGSSFLINTIPSPYRFIVHLVMPEDGARTEQVLTKFRNVLSLEKPAHTDYYLKLSPHEDVDDLKKMQIEVRSSIGLDTAIG